MVYHTLGAAEWFLISVDSFMDLQMIGVAECFATHQAAEWFIAGVDSFMSFQIT